MTKKVAITIQIPCTLFPEHVSLIAGILCNVGVLHPGFDRHTYPDWVVFLTMGIFGHLPQSLG